MAHSNEHHHDDSHSPQHYVKIYGILIVLLVISIAGPEVAPAFGSAGLYVMLFTAFGIAFVKAWLVIKHFMHLTIEKSWVGYTLITCLVLMVLFLAGTSPDVYKHEGTNWENHAAKDEIQRVLDKYADGAEHGDHGHGDEAPAEEAVAEEAAEAPAEVPAKPATFADMKSDAEKKSYLMKKGEKLYAEKLCVTCHRSNGAGHGPFPPLVGQKEFMGDCAKTIGIINNGMNEPIQINGVEYTMPMPATKVTAEEGAAIATYIRNSWGNDYGVCTP